MEVGRPTSYNESMCEDAIKYFSLGCSKEEVAVKLGISESSFYKYIKEHPEFSKAVKEGEFKAIAWWKEQGRINLGTPKWNYIGWAMQMKNRFQYRTDEQPIKLPALKRAKTFTEKIDVILDAARKGSISLSEAKKLADTVAIGARVEEVTELRKILEEIEEAGKGE